MRLFVGVMILCSSMAFAAPKPSPTPNPKIKKYAPLTSAEAASLHQWLQKKVSKHEMTQAQADQAMVYGPAVYAVMQSETKKKGAK